MLDSMKSQTPSTKLQTNLKFQYSMTKTGLEFRILVIVICLIFDICDLEFIFLQCFTTPEKNPSLVGSGFFILSVRVPLPGHRAWRGPGEIALLLEPVQAHPEDPCYLYTAGSLPLFRPGARQEPFL